MFERFEHPFVVVSATGLYTAENAQRCTRGEGFELPMDYGLTNKLFLAYRIRAIRNIIKL